MSENINKAARSETQRVSDFSAEPKNADGQIKDLSAAPATEKPEKGGEEIQTIQEKNSEAVKAALEEIRAKSKESLEAMREGKGRLKLEKPIMAGDKPIDELIYDFNDMSGVEYTSAMDSDMNARDNFKITYRQSLALFAAAAAKHTEALDSRDIMEKIGMTDAVEGVQLATSFFVASTRAGRLRISKWSSK